MTRDDMERWAHDIGARMSFEIEKSVHEGTYYDPQQIRSKVYLGRMHDEPCALKLWDDPRGSDEPIALRAFLQSNTGERITAPHLIIHELHGRNRGWMITRALPASAVQLSSPIPADQRSLFLELFLEYRHAFDRKPSRRLTLQETLPAAEFHTVRISNWLGIAASKDPDPVLPNAPSRFPDTFPVLYTKALGLIRATYDAINRPMEWSHGHFKPNQLFLAPETGQWYLTDFAHHKCYPHGYELALIIWADWMMAADPSLSYADWRQGVVEWIEILRERQADLTTCAFDQLMRAALLERCLGAALVDAKVGPQLAHILRLADELVAGPLQAKAPE